MRAFSVAAVVMLLLAAAPTQSRAQIPPSLSATADVETIRKHIQSDVPSEQAWGAWLDDGSFVARVWQTPDAMTLTKTSVSNEPEKIGTIPHETLNFSHSADLKRATLGWRDKRADAFMYRVVK
jgi:hypothetical protein